MTDALRKRKTLIRLQDDLTDLNVQTLNTLLKMLHFVESTIANGNLQLQKD